MPFEVKRYEDLVFFTRKILDNPVGDMKKSKLVVWKWMEDKERDGEGKEVVQGEGVYGHINISTAERMNCQRVRTIPANGVATFL